MIIQPITMAYKVENTLLVPRKGIGMVAYCKLTTGEWATLDTGTFAFPAYIFVREAEDIEELETVLNITEAGAWGKNE